MHSYWNRNLGNGIVDFISTAKSAKFAPSTPFGIGGNFCVFRILKGLVLRERGKVWYNKKWKVEN